MDKKILLYKLSDKKLLSDDFDFCPYTLKIWKPGLFQYIPPNKSIKYLIYWVFHYLRIFKNRNYSAYLLFDKNVIVSSLLIVPSHFKWPFMGKKDVQFTYVMTNEKYKGKGLAGHLIRRAISDLKKNSDNYWYVTDSINIPSMKVAQKIGFEMYSEAEKTKLFGILSENL